MRSLFRSFCFLFSLAGISLLLSTPTQAGPLDQWRVSCGVDDGAITKSRGIWTFRPSSNHCPGGIFQQRAEINTEPVRASHKGAYLFETRISMTTNSSEKFDIFQIHDGRLGCAPPLKLTVLGSGQIELISDIKTGPGESCIRGKLSQNVTPARIRRDGTEQHLEVLIAFDGTGGFDATVWIDGVVQISGRYDPSSEPEAFRPEKYYFKHGVYSQRMFDYVLVSRGMKVSRVRLGT